MYGRKWIWDGYFGEKNMDKWLETAEDLKKINIHVLQDIEDSILLETFKGMKEKKVQEYIENDNNIRISDQKKLFGKGSEAFMEKALEDNKKRKFLYQLRPPYYWNFFEDCKEEEKVSHLLRYNAKPAESYRDGRVEKIM